MVFYNGSMSWLSQGGPGQRTGRTLSALFRSLIFILSVAGRHGNVVSSRMEWAASVQVSVIREMDVNELVSVAAVGSGIERNHWFQPTVSSSWRQKLVTGRVSEGG